MDQGSSLRTANGSRHHVAGGPNSKVLMTGSRELALASDENVFFLKGFSRKNIEACERIL